MAQDKTNDQELDEELELHEYNNDEDTVYLNTHQKVNSDFSGEITVMEKGYVEIRLTTTPDIESSPCIYSVNSDTLAFNLATLIELVIFCSIIV